MYDAAITDRPRVVLSSFNTCCCFAHPSSVCVCVGVCVNQNLLGITLVNNDGQNAVTSSPLINLPPPFCFELKRNSQRTVNLETFCQHKMYMCCFKRDVSICCCHIMKCLCCSWYEMVNILLLVGMKYTHSVVCAKCTYLIKYISRPSRSLLASCWRMNTNCFSLPSNLLTTKVRHICLTSWSFIFLLDSFAFPLTPIPFAFLQSIWNSFVNTNSRIRPLF